MFPTIKKSVVGIATAGKLSEVIVGEGSLTLGESILRSVHFRPRYFLNRLLGHVWRSRGHSIKVRRLSFVERVLVS